MKERVAEICLAFPDTSRVAHGSHSQFLVKKKTFAYFLDNHHGDGIVSVTCRVFPGDNEVLVKADPARFYLPAYMAHRGWVALRLDVGEPDWEEVSELLQTGYKLVAPIVKRKSAVGT